MGTYPAFQQGGNNSNPFLDYQNSWISIVSDNQMDVYAAIGTLATPGWVAVIEGAALCMIPVAATLVPDPPPTVEFTGGRGRAAGFLVYGPISDDYVKYFNQLEATGIPPNGQFSWSVNNSQRLTLNPSGSPETIWPIVASPSVSANDTTITVNYSVNGVAAQPATLSTTATIYRYLIQDGTYTPSNEQPFGYTGLVYYDLYAQPGQHLVPVSGLSTQETVSVISVTPSDFQNQIQTVLSDGNTDPNGRIVDKFAVKYPSPLPSNLSIVNRQDIFVEGIFVRNNTLTFSNTTVTIASNGPNN